MKLELKNLTKHYGEICALSNFSATFTKGVYGILGANGAGKSTLMNLITDNVAYESGEIYFENQRVWASRKTFREKIGYMPQQQGYYEEMSARSYLYYIGRLKGLSGKQLKKQVEELLEIVNLKDEAHQLLRSFSGGMKQRVMLAQALLGNPSILLLDEPTAGLDPRERIRIRNYIAKIARERIVLLATHIVSDIECIASNVLIMKKGELKSMTTPEQLISNIIGKVGQIQCTFEEAEKLQKQYGMGTMIQSNDGVVLRLVGDKLPEQSHIITNGITLEDVYLYYFCNKNT